jgi:hypothetical protein
VRTFDQPEPPSAVDRTKPVRGSVGNGVLVVLGWYATVIAAVVVGEMSLPARHSTDCSGMFSCLDTGQFLLLIGLFVGLPVVFGSLLIATITVALLMRRLRSPVVAGTIAAVVGVGAPGLIWAAWNGVR